MHALSACVSPSLLVSLSWVDTSVPGSHLPCTLNTWHSPLAMGVHSLLCLQQTLTDTPLGPRTLRKGGRSTRWELLNGFGSPDHASPGGSGSFRLSGPPSSSSLGLLGVSYTSIALALQAPSPTEWHLALEGEGESVPGCWLAWLGGCGDWQRATPSLTAWVFPEWLLLHEHFSGHPPLPFS